MKGVIIQHGCDKKLFISEETLENMCAIICPGCGEMIGLTLFGSNRGEQLLKYCKDYTKEEITKILKENERK